MSLKKFLPTFSALCFLLSALPLMAIEAPPRLFFSDAQISFEFPEHWTMDARFPFGPLFWKATKDNQTAAISCLISGTLPGLRATQNLSGDALKKLVEESLMQSEPQAKILSQEELSWDDHTALLLTWSTAAETRLHLSAYFFHEMRLYAISLEAPTTAFDYLKTDFTKWIKTIQLLSRQGSGALARPARGGMWIHQTAGGRMRIPPEWLVSVADDRLLGLSTRIGEAEAYWTASVIPQPTGKSISKEEQTELRRSITTRGYTFLNARLDSVKTFPTYQVNYQGKRNGVPVRGRDILILTPKARWLLSVEVDASVSDTLLTNAFPLLKELQFF